MAKPTVAIGADHGGFETKSKLTKYLTDHGYRVLDMGTSGPEASDYPIFGFRVAEAVSRRQANFGVLLCRSGNGMSMAANKVHGIRAAIANNCELARLARQHNDANVLVMGSDFMQDGDEEVLGAFLESEPDNGRHKRRVDLIKDYDRTLESHLPTYQLIQMGQSPWLDDISDTLLASGELKRMIEEEGIRGLTSNPSIFEKAINSGEGRYQAELAELKTAGVSPEAAYEKLTTEDIQAAADLLLPLHEATGGDDGFVSLEVLPEYAYDEETTVSEAKRLFALVDRPNLMIKVPGTEEGIRAFRRLTAEGIHINVTLIFSRSSYNEIARAYIAGLQDRLAAGGGVSRVRSVASVFISRIDTAVDQQLLAVDASKKEIVSELLYKTAIDNTRLIYQDFKELFYGEKFADLAAHGAMPQRPLWGSTSAKNPELRDTIYAEELVGPQTVNTLPMNTIHALNDHGKVRGATLNEDLAGAEERGGKLAELGIDLGEVCDDLQKAGVQSFADAFEKLFDSIKRQLA